MIPYIYHLEDDYDQAGNYRIWLAGTDRSGAFRIAEPISIKTDDPDGWLAVNRERALDELDGGHGAILRISNGQIKQLDDNEATAWEEIRAERNDRLTATDWTQVSDAPITEDQRKNHQQIRQQLRDIPGEFDDPYNVIWPD